MNSNNVWSEEQIKAYAAAFREGDAVKAGNEWYEVFKDKNDFIRENIGHAVDTPEKNIRFRLNYFDSKGVYKGVTNGFKYNSSVEYLYEIITPKDYEVQKGDKLVWLGKTQKQGSRSEYTFGKVYDVERHGDRLIYKDDMTLSILARSEKDRWKFWELFQSGKM